MAPCLYEFNRLCSCGTNFRGERERERERESGQIWLFHSTYLCKSVGFELFPSPRLFVPRSGSLISGRFRHFGCVAFSRRVKRQHNKGTTKLWEANSLAPSSFLSFSFRFPASSDDKYRSVIHNYFTFWHRQPLPLGLIGRLRRASFEYFNS